MTIQKELTKEEKLQALKQIEAHIKKEDDNTRKTDIFTEGIKYLMTPENIELKTEYQGKNENFAGVKLEYLAIFGNMPQLKPFVNIFEKKRVSLDRKGRKEIIMPLQQREKEIQMQKEISTTKMLGY